MELFLLIKITIIVDICSTKKIGIIGIHIAGCEILYIDNRILVLKNEGGKRETQKNHVYIIKEKKNNERIYVCIYIYDEK